MTEEPPGNARNHERDDYGKDKSPRAVFHAVDEVHTKHRGDERGYHHDNRHGGQRTHHRVHIVINNRRVGVHRRFQNVGVD